MENNFNKLIKSLETSYYQKGLCLQQGNYFLFTPKEALAFLDEVSNLKLDYAILGLTLWDRDTDGDYFESPDLFNFDDVKRDVDFVELSYRETKRFLGKLVGDPNIDRLVITFENEKFRERRINHIKNSRH